MTGRFHFQKKTVVLQKSSVDSCGIIFIAFINSYWWLKTRLKTKSKICCCHVCAFAWHQCANVCEGLRINSTINFACVRLHFHLQRCCWASNWTAPTYCRLLSGCVWLLHERTILFQHHLVQSSLTARRLHVSKSFFNVVIEYLKLFCLGKFIANIVFDSFILISEGG